MQELLVNFLDNAEQFLNRIPEFKGSKLFVRADGDVPFITNDTIPAGTKKAQIQIGVDNETMQESRVLVTKVHFYNPMETEASMMLSMLVQMVLSDLISFALAQTIVMYRKADIEGVVLQDKQVQDIKEGPIAAEA